MDIFSCEGSVLGCMQEKIINAVRLYWPSGPLFVMKNGIY